MTHEELGSEIGKLVDEKNVAYGSSFAQSGQILAVLFPNGIKPEQMRDALAITRILDKLFRIATRKRAFGESPYRDIAGYALLGAMLDDREAEAFEDPVRTALESQLRPQGATVFGTEEVRTAGNGEMPRDDDD